MKDREDRTIHGIAVLQDLKCGKHEAKACHKSTSLIQINVVWVQSTSGAKKNLTH